MLENYYLKAEFIVECKMFLVFCTWMAFVIQIIITTVHAYLMKYLQQLPIHLPYGFRHAIRGNYFDYFYLIKSTYPLDRIPTGMETRKKNISFHFIYFSSVYILEECATCVSNQCKKCVDYFGGLSTRCIDLIMNLNQFFECNPKDKLQTVACKTLILWV